MNKSIMEYERGILLDFVLNTTNLSNMDLINLQYLTKKNILKYHGDVTYLFANVRARKCIKEIKEKHPEYISEAKEMIEELGIIEDGGGNFNTYYGMLSNYAWHKNPSSGGAGYSDIFDLIEKLKDKLKERNIELNSICRRLAYLETLLDEVYYLLDNFDYDKVPLMIDWLNNRFETFTAFSAQTSLNIIDFYYREHPKLKNLDKNTCVFENIFDLLRNEASFFNSPNDAIYSLTIVELRNSIVHGKGLELVKKNNKIFIQFNLDLSGKIKNYDVLLKWLEEKIIPMFNGKKNPDTWYRFSDPHFEFVTWNLRLQKNSKFDINEPKIEINIEMKKYADLVVKFFLYHICSKLFRNLLKNLK